MFTFYYKIPGHKVRN